MTPKTQTQADTKRRGQRRAFAPFVAILLALMGPAWSSAAYIQDADQVVSACRSGAGQVHASIKPRVIEVLIAATPPASQWPRYRAEALAAVAAACSYPGAKLVIRAVSPDAILESPRFSRSTPSSAGPNPLLGLVGRESFAREAIAAIDSFGRSAPQSSRPESDDVVSALYIAARDGSDGGTQAVLVLHSGWPRHLYVYRSDIRKHTNEIIAKIRANGNMPTFVARSSVFLGGLARGQMQGDNSLEILSLCDFYTEFLRSGGAQLVNCPVQPSDDELTDSLR